MEYVSTTLQQRWGWLEILFLRENHQNLQEKPMTKKLMEADFKNELEITTKKIREGHPNVKSVFHIVFKILKTLVIELNTRTEELFQKDFGKTCFKSQEIPILKSMAWSTSVQLLYKKYAHLKENYRECLEYILKNLESKSLSIQGR